MEKKQHAGVFLRAGKVLVDEIQGAHRYRLGVPPHAPKFIWQKAAAPAWLVAHGGSLTVATKGTHAVVENPNQARLRIEFFCEDRAKAEALRQAFGGSICRLPSDWETQWFSAHRTKPLRIGQRLLVTCEASDSANALVIPASVAFGTGEHATTAMSLRLLERITRRRAPGWRMLDAGTGSGILALAGQRFGAGKVLAIDNDPLALKTAKWNARENKIRGVDFRVADVTQAVAGRFDIITANLFSELLISVLPRFRRALRKDGQMILSGVLRTQEDGLRRVLGSTGFSIQIARRRGKWVALLAVSSS